MAPLCQAVGLAGEKGDEGGAGGLSPWDAAGHWGWGLGAAGLTPGGAVLSHHRQVSSERPPRATPRQGPVPCGGDIAL